MAKVYPVIFTQTDDMVLIEVPDLEILTEGTDMVDAIYMARDAIGLKGICLEDDGMEIPPASKMESIDPNKGTFSGDGINLLSLVDVDFIEYRRKNDNKMVRRNVTLPNWLNLEADKLQLNVSKVLQEALMSKVNIQR